MSPRIFTALHFAPDPVLWVCSVFYVAAETSRQAENILANSGPYINPRRGRLFIQTDSNMRDMDGFNCCTNVKQITPNSREDRIPLTELERWVAIMTNASGDDESCDPRAPIYREVKL